MENDKRNDFMQRRRNGKRNTTKQEAQPMAKIVAVAAIKGGTGKTTTAGALAQAAARDGKQVLAIDLDPQSNLSIWLNANLSRPSSYHLIAGKAGPQEAVQATQSGVYCIAGNANLTALKTTPGSGRRLEQAIEPILKAFDLIVIDTAPAMGELQNQALFAATDLLIPLESDSSSLQGLYQIMDVLQLVQQAKPTVKVLGVVLTKYDNRPKINRYMRDAIKDKGQQLGAPLLMEIRSGIAIREAMAMQQNLFEYAPRSKPAQDYQKLYECIMEG